MNRINKSETKTLIRALLSARNSHCGIYTLNKDFREETGMDIPLFGYSSLSEFLGSMPDTVQLSGLFPVQKVTLVENETSAHIRSLVSKQRDKKSKKKKCGYGEGNSNKNYRFNDQRPSTSNDNYSDTRRNNLPCKIQNEASARNFVPRQTNESCSRNRRQEIENPGFDQKQDMPCRHNCRHCGAVCSSCGSNEGFSCIHSGSQRMTPQAIPEFRPMSGISERFENPGYVPKQIMHCGNDFNAMGINYSASANDKTNLSYIQNASQEMAFLAFPDFTPNCKFSEWFLRDDEELPTIDLRIQAKTGHYIEVFACEISDPGSYHVHFRDFKEKLRTFMRNFREFYNLFNQIPSPSQMPQLDQVFATSYSMYGDPAQWYRVQVKELLGNHVVGVRFIDYGITAKIFIKNLRLLHRNFTSLPRQAITGSLANIRPPGHLKEWSGPAKKRFYELAFGRDLIGGVVSVNDEEYKLSLALTSTVGEEIHVNDTLVEEGLAIFEVDDPNAPNAAQEVECVQTCDLPSTDLYPRKTRECMSRNTRLQKLFMGDD